MTIELRNLKGTGDFMPQEQRVRQEIIRKLQDIFEKYGYQPIETPIISYFDVLASKYAGGAEILKEVYKLYDQGGRELGLRYDLTVPFARLVGMNPEIRMPFKRYEIGKVYRDGPVKTGRNREFIQCDVDMVGVKSVMAEAELMLMAVEVYKMLGLDVYISYNNRKLLSGIIESVGIEPAFVSKVILSIDKLKKIGNDGVEAELLQLGIAAAKINILLKYMKMQPDELTDAFVSKQRNERIAQGVKELNELVSYIESLGIRNALRFTPSLARGLEIYTGTVWEVFLTDGSITSSVGAGGRYDNIIGAFIENGVDYPAVGMTFGLDVIYEALMLKDAIPVKPPVDLYIIPLGTENACLKLATELRNKGLKVDVDMADRRLKKSLDFANKQGIPYVVVIGENELDSGALLLKEMKTGKEYIVSMEKLGEFSMKLLSEGKRA
jgi:histidyl-tRNA synthetase